MTQSLQWKVDSKVGALYLTASPKGLQGVFRKRQAVPMAKSLEESGPQAAVLAETVRQLQEYFKGERTRFELPFDVKGTEFQKQVWSQLNKIPYGKTCSYGDVAREIKNRKAVRAVGTANGKNPLCIIVPCHRVIASDGSLGGYAGGLAMKRKLLELERASGKSPIG